MARQIIITLLRNDLRVHDNAILHAAHQASAGATHILPMFVFDERFIELSGLPGYDRQGPPAKTRLCGFWRTSVFRARFLAEAVYDLRDRLRGKNQSDLLIRFGKAELVLADLVKKLKEGGDEVKGVYMQKEFYSEERAVTNKMKKLLRELGTPITFFDTTPLIDVRDLPFAVHETPDVFTPFRKRVESCGKLGRAPLLMPVTFKPFPEPKLATTSYGAQFDKSGLENILPHLLSPLRDSYETKFTDSNYPRHENSAVPFAGGETAALARLSFYFHQGSPPPAAKYKETRNGLLGHSYSTKMSPFLALGCVSPRTIMDCLDAHEAKFGESDNTYWVRFEMLWRDYFLFIGRKFGTALFKLGGLEEITDPKQARIKTWPGWWNTWDQNGPADQPAVRWMEGKTGVPFIDANMSELRESGFMSNRGRQNVASFLTKDLQVDWRVGAEFFEAHLIDHEPSANYGNWAYVAGVGNDPRASRQFNPIKQGNDYDPHGEYIKTWLPQLKDVPTGFIQSPWRLSPQDRQRYITGSYPESPVIEQSHWKPHYTKRGANKTSGNPNERVKNPGPGGGRSGHSSQQQAPGGRGGHSSRGGRGGGGGRGRGMSTQQPITA